MTTNASTSRPFEQGSNAGATTISDHTLTSFDWLDTCIEQAAARTDLQAARHLEPLAAAATESSTVFAINEASSRVLGKVVLGFSPVIDRYEGVIATRLTVVPQRVGVTPDVDALLQAIGEVWPEQGGPVVLNVSSESLVAV